MDFGIACNCACFQNSKWILTRQTSLSIVAAFPGIGVADASSRFGTSPINSSSFNFVSTCVNVLDLLSFDLYLGEEECVGSELLNGVENISDSLDGHLCDLVHPVVDDFENLFVLVCPDDVADDVVLVRCIYLDEAGCLRLSLEFFGCFLADLIVQLYLPGRAFFPVGSVENSGECDLANNEEVLVHLVHQVFEVGVDRCLGINSGLLIGK